jgi:hypothetical protein
VSTIGHVVSALEPSAEHDCFHPPTSDDPWWSETTWFNFMVPERKLYCYVYPWVKANQGICGGGVMAWDDRGRTPLDALHWDYQWSHPYPELGDLRDITFPTGVSIKCLEPLTSYALSYEHPAFAFDVRWDAILPVHLLEDDGSGTFAGHLDQQGRVSGTVTVAGETLPVDCHGIRDRSWGRRVPTPGMHIGYDICTSADAAFVAFSSPDDDGKLLGGYLWHAGDQVTLAAGTRVLERDGVWPSRVVIAAVDGQGRHLDAVGTPLNWMGFQNLPSMTNLISLVRWQMTVDDGDPLVAFGELEDVWDAELFRRFARAGATNRI